MVFGVKTGHPGNFKFSGLTFCQKAFYICSIKRQIILLFELIFC